MLYNIKKFSVKIFLLICVFVVFPLIGVSIYITRSMEKFLQNQMTDNVFQNISRNERNIYDNLQKLAYFSNGIIVDEELQDKLGSRESSQYENAKYFQTLLDRIAYNTSDRILEETKVILFDNYGHCYSNWGLNYQDYFFLLKEDWVQEAESADGHIIWSMFNPAYIVEDGEDEQYISLARTIPEINGIGKQIGTLIMSINRSAFKDLVTEYTYEGDKIFVCLEDGKVLMTNDSLEFVTDDDIREIFAKTENGKKGKIKERLNSEEYLVSYYTLRKPWQFNGEDMKILYFTNYQDIQEQISGIVRKLQIVIVVAFVLILWILFAASRWLVSPIGVLTKKMDSYTIEEEIRGIDILRKDEIGSLNRAFVRMSDKLNEAFRRLKAEQEIQERYRYESLRAQINPHFLFNTLTSIRWMAVIRGADNIVESIDALANLLRYSFGRDREQAYIKEELENIKNYVYIQNLRYGDHVSLDIDVDEEICRMKTIKFILQPIVENAILHGYDSSRQGVLHIYIYGDVEENVLHLFVEDDGIGISRDVIEQFQNEKNVIRRGSKMTGIGLHNVDECIQITFGKQYGLKLGQSNGKGTVVEFILPVICEGGEKSHEKTDDRG